MYSLTTERQSLGGRVCCPWILAEVTTQHSSAGATNIGTPQCYLSKLLFAGKNGLNFPCNNMQTKSIHCTILIPLTTHRGRVKVRKGGGGGGNSRGRQTVTSQVEEFTSERETRCSL